MPTDEKDWPRKGAQMPRGLHELVVKRAKEIRGGKTGLVKYVWTVAALQVLGVDKEVLRRGATRLRDICDQHLDRIIKVFESGDRIAAIDLLAKMEAKRAEEAAETLTETGRKTRKRREARRV